MLFESKESKREKDGQGSENSNKGGPIELDQASQSN